MTRKDRAAVHAYLDGALSQSEIEALRRRAADDAELGTHLARMESLQSAMMVVRRADALAVSTPPAFIPPVATPPRRRLGLGMAFAVAALVLGVVGTLAWQRSVPASASAAQVEVTFSLEAPKASVVQVAGDFSSWKPIELRRDGPVWRTAMTLPRGRYAYMYLVDGEWTTDPSASSVRDDDFGNRNAVLHL